MSEKNRVSVTQKCTQVPDKFNESHFADRKMTVTERWFDMRRVLSFTSILVKKN